MDLSRFNWQIVLTVATVSMLVQQAFSYVCQIALPILANRLAQEFDISPAWLGLYLFIQNAVSIIAAVGCGSFILRFGPLRISQISLTLMALSLLLVASGQLWLYPLSAILMGCSALSTPASSHILARVCPPRLASLVFSIKQTGVPVGSFIGGLMLPFFLGLVITSRYLDNPVTLGPFGTAFLTATIVLCVVFALQPVRAFFDADRQRDVKFSFGDLPATLKSVLGNPALRHLAFAGFAFGGLQSLFAGFFILYLIDGLNYSEVEAGSAFATASFTAIWARILWGWLGGRRLPPRRILAGIGLVGGIAALLMTGFDATWTLWQITAVAIIYNISALSWHGLLLAETARLAPEGRVGGITGGILAFVSFAMLTYPAIFAVILAVTGSYKIGFAIGALPAFAACVVFFHPLKGRNQRTD